MQQPEINHIIILSEGAVGPLMTSEVIRFFEENPEKIQLIQWISPESQEPLLLIEWFSDFAAIEALDHILSRAVPPPSLRPQNRNDTASGERQIAGSSLRPTSSVKPSDYLKPKQQYRSWREWLSLIGLGFLGVAILVAGLKSIKPYRHQLRRENSLQAKLIQATPDALRAYQLLLEGKIQRDGKKYALGLLLMQKDKGLYPEGFLPSEELTAALALTHVPSVELDARDEWKKFLVTLPIESRQRGLAVLGYELSRLLDSRKNSISERSKLKNKKASASLDEALISLERLTRIIPGTEPENRAIHGVFLARIISLSMLSIIENSQAAARIKDVSEILDKVPSLYSYLAEHDKMIVSSLLSYTKQKVNEPSKSFSGSDFLQNLWQIHVNTSFLCQLNQSGAAVDAILYALTQASLQKQKIPELPGLFDGCFVGLRAYPKVSGQSVVNNESSTFDFFSTGFLDQSILTSFRKQFPTMNPAIKRLSGAGAKNGSGDWLLALHFNDVLGGKLVGGVKPPSKEKLCGKALLKEQICLQAFWAELRGRWKDSIQILPEFQENVKSTDLAALMQRYVFDAAKEILYGNGRRKQKEISDVFSQLSEFGLKEDPELQFLLDYVRTFEGDS